MGKILLIYVLFLVVVSTTLETEVKKEDTSRLWSNLLIMLSSLTIISIMFIISTFIIICSKKVLVIVAYKVQDLFTTYRKMICATLKLKFLGIILQVYVCWNMPGW